MDLDLEAMEASSVGRPCCAVWESHADRETGCKKPCTGKGKNARHFTGLGAQATLMAALFFSSVSLACAIFSLFFSRSFYWPVWLAQRGLEMLEVDPLLIATLTKTVQHLIADHGGEIWFCQDNY